MPLLLLTCAIASNINIHSTSLVAPEKILALLQQLQPVWIKCPLQCCEYNVSRFSASNDEGVNKSGLRVVWRESCWFSHAPTAFYLGGVHGFGKHCWGHLSKFLPIESPSWIPESFHLDILFDFPMDTYGGSGSNITQKNKLLLFNTTAYIKRTRLSLCLDFCFSLHNLFLFYHLAERMCNQYIINACA